MRKKSIDIWVKILKAKNAEKVFLRKRTAYIVQGMQHKVLQKLLGHASIQITMDRYVYVTDESMQKAVQ